LITILENKNTKYADGVFQTLKDAKLYLVRNPSDKWELRELEIDRFPFFEIVETDVNSDGVCPPLYVSSKDAVVEYIKNINLKEFARHYDDPDDDQIFILYYVTEAYKPEDNVFVGHSHIIKKQVEVNKRFITQGQIARAKRCIFNFDSDFFDTEVGIFWLSTDLKDVIYSITVYVSDIDLSKPEQYCFSHRTEWENQGINDIYDDEIIEGNYNDYPRGRIFFSDNSYQVEINVPASKKVERIIRHQFSLPRNTIFSFGHL
jgi:hypothetical protein